MDKNWVDNELVRRIEEGEGIRVDTPEAWYALMERRFRLRYADRCVTCRWYGGIGLSLVRLSRWWTSLCYRRSGPAILAFAPVLYVCVFSLRALGKIIKLLPCIGRCKREEEKEERKD
jgi:hypothetical protein